MISIKNKKLITNFLKNPCTLIDFNKLCNLEDCVEEIYFKLLPKTPIH